MRTSNFEAPGVLPCLFLFIAPPGIAEFELSNFAEF